MAQAVSRVLRGERRAEARVELVSRLLGVLGADEDAVVEQSRQLLSVSYATHQHWGERPIAITWRLHTPMPADHFAVASVVA